MASSPTATELLAALMHIRIDAAVDVVDVRLVALPTKDPYRTTWALTFGDVSYDMTHGIACSTATITSTDSVATLHSTAVDLIIGLEDQLEELEPSRHYW